MPELTTPGAKYKYMPTEWVLLEHRLHSSTQPCEATPQISDAGRNPDSCSRLRSNHPARHSKTARSVVPSAVPSMLTRARANSI